MEQRRIGIIMNGVTGRMGTNQHLIRSITAIIQQGGVKISPDLTLMPDPILTGRNANKLKALAEAHGPGAIGKPYKFSTDVDGVIAGKEGDYEVFFDASGTLQRAGFLEKACASEMIKAVYCEKPTATETDKAVAIADMVEKAGKKNGVVQDKLWLSSFRKIAMLKELGFFGKILSVKGDFGYWVFSGMDSDQPMQRPSWNYRAEDGGGMMIDMFCHWEYVITNLFGPIKSLVAHGHIDLDERRAEDGKPFKCTADDSAYAMFLLEDGTMCQFNSSWATRVRRDDLLTVHVDGTKGSAVAGLREVYTQSAANTPKPVWNPDIEQPIDFYGGWELVPNNIEYDNAFKIQWELFLRHVALDEPFTWDLRAGARGVQLAELGMQSWREKCWVDVPGLD
ncbi:Gfo/Idh/MocA family protein [Algisphaera agarilytica]|uniref:Putative dehydrogenase n=1 Tax=Algisphaera agarilytica TaxID=1385975 RepID=A0A7X0H667_9BACT|nr:Gfo/Idh/MocA family oxidoreductase [Algisphaera agarilytica]MBB6428826.1 putative dehydrogenase [Algisphaera agarilytica]